MGSTTVESAPARQGAATAGAPRYGRVAALALGDLAVFIIFVVVGQSSHRETESVASIVRVAAPFVVAWFVVGPVLGAFGRRGSAATTRPQRLLGRTGLSWVVACPAALALRALGEGHGIPSTFALISFLFNGVLLLGWRGLASWLAWRR
jgi:hypothetical protein